MAKTYVNVNGTQYPTDTDVRLDSGALVSRQPHELEVAT